MQFLLCANRLASMLSRLIDLLDVRDGRRFFSHGRDGESGKEVCGNQFHTMPHFSPSL